MLTAARRWLAPALLVLVAATQMVLAHTHALNPWTGGGFGMFSTLDRLRTRVVRVWTPDGERLILPRSLRRQTIRARTLPTPARLEALATAAAGALGQPIRLELVRLRFAGDRRPRVMLEPLAEVHAP